MSYAVFCLLVVVATVIVSTLVYLIPSDSIRNGVYTFFMYFGLLYIARSIFGIWR